MTKHTLSLSADIDTTAAQEADQISSLRAGEDLPACHPVKIGANFRVFKALAGDKVDGISSPRKAYTGQPVTVFGLGIRFRATETNLDPTKLYGLSNVAGEFDDAATTKLFRPVSLHDLQLISLGATAV